jgi:DNA repair photolyase
MRISEADCKRALVASRLPGIDYALNPYRGCSFGCVYCYSPAVLRDPRPWGDFVEVRRNIPYVLAKELKSGRPGVVGIGTVTDAYQSAEGRYRLTRLCLKQLRKHDWPISIQTKSPLVVRDLDILRGFTRADVGFSFTVLDETMRSLFEPRAPTVKAGLSALRNLVSSGVEAWAFLGPILPGVTEADVDELLDVIADTGVRTVIVDRLRVRPVIWENMRTALRDHPILMYAHRKALWEDPDYFPKILGRIKARCRELGMTYEDAFPSRTRPGSEIQRRRGSGGTTLPVANRLGL